MYARKNAAVGLKNAFTVENVGECYTVLPGVVSRKKQFLPAIVEALQQ